MVGFGMKPSEKSPPNILGVIRITVCRGDWATLAEVCSLRVLF